MTAQRIRVTAFANYFVLFISFGILTPYLQLYLKARGLEPSRIGVLLGCLELAGVVGPLVLGRLADLRGGYRVLIVTCLLTSIAVFIPLQMTVLFPVHVIALVVLGAAYRSVMPLQDSIVSTNLADPTREYGRLRVAGSLGFFAISLFLQLTGVLTGDSATAIFVAFAIAVACAALATTTLPLAAKGSRGSSRALLAGGVSGIDLRFWVIIFVVFLGRFAMGAYYSFFSLFLKQSFPQSGVSLFWAIGPLAEMVTIFTSGSLIARWGLRAMFIVSLLAISLRLGLFVVAPSILVVGLAQLLHAFTFGTFHTSAVAYVNRTIAAERRGTGMAIYNAVGVGLPTFLASVAGGYILQAHGFAALFLGYGAVPLVGVVILGLFGKRLLGEQRAAATAAS